MARGILTRQYFTPEGQFGSEDSLTLQSSALSNKEMTQSSLFRLLVDVKDLIAKIEGHTVG